MINYEDNNVFVKKSSINGLGVYVKRNFKKGQTIIYWHPLSKIPAKDLPKLSDYDQDRTTPLGDGNYIIMGIPERYINHSCDPNSFVKDNKEDVALRDIKKGEEITSDYSVNGIDHWKLKCCCGSKNCRKIVYGNFFKLPKNLQMKYAPYLQKWFKEKYKSRLEKLK